MIYLQSLMVPTSGHDGLQQRIPKAELTGKRVILGRFGFHSVVALRTFIQILVALSQQIST
jgi:hypothetical protein